MGTISIFLGIIFFLAFGGGGFYLSNMLVEYLQSNQLYMTLIPLKDVNAVYYIIVGICAFLGFLICWNFVMHGVNSNKLSKLLSQNKKRGSRHKAED